MATVTEYYASPMLLHGEVSPLRHVGDMVARGQGRDSTAVTTYETYRALPSPQQPYGDYDYAIVGEVIRTAEANVARAYKKGQGSGLVTLQNILQAYEQVLPRHGVKPDEDTYYYRLILKLSLDPNLDWWAKLNREVLSSTSRVRAPSPYRSPPRSGHGLGARSQTQAHAGRTSGSPSREMQQAAARTAAAQQAAAAAAAAASKAASAAARSSTPSTRAYGAPDSSASSYNVYGPGGPIGAGGAGGPFGAGGLFGAGGPGGPFGAYGPGAYGPGGLGPYVPGGLGPYGSGMGLDASGLGRAGGADQGVGSSSGGGMDAGGGARRDQADLLSQLDEPLQDEEVEAYLDFRRLASAFRTWRTHAYLLKHSRHERDQALRNWAIATAFWRMHTLRRLFDRWRVFGKRKLALALNIWGGNTLGGCFRRWHMIASHLVAKGQEVDLWRRSLLLTKAWKQWRTYATRKRKQAQGLLKSLEHWHGRSLRGCFQLWRLFVEESRQAWSLSGAHLKHRMLMKWSIAARVLAKERRAADAIKQYDERRLMVATLQAWRQQRIFQSHSANRLRGAVARMRNGTLVRAFNKWSEAIQAKRLRKEKLAHAMAWWGNRQLAMAWGALQSAVERARELDALARQHARKVLRPLLAAAFYAWSDWHSAKADRSHRAATARAIVQRQRNARLLRSWRGQVHARKHQEEAFKHIMRREVHRLLGMGFRRWYKEHDNLHRALDAEEDIRRSCARRCIRHWKTFALYKRDHAQWRLDRVKQAGVQRKRRVLTAFRLVAALGAEHKRLIVANRQKMQRRLAHSVMGVLRDRVLYRSQKRMKLLSALLYWEKVTRLKALDAWVDRVNGWRAKRRRSNAALWHYYTRLKAIAFSVLLAGWQAYQERLTRALLFRSFKNDGLKRDIIDAWRQLVAYLQYKNNKIRLALAHSRSKSLGGAFYGWYAVTQHRLDQKRKTATALLYRLQRVRALAFLWWRNWAAYRRDLLVRGNGYLVMRLMRAKEKAMLMLRANVIRKRRSRQAYAHRERYLRRLALSAWMLRILLKADFVNNLRVVGSQLGSTLVEDCFLGWVDVAAYRRYKRGMLHAALRYYRLNRQRASLHALRWNVMRRRLKRAVTLRGRLGAVSRALQAWHDEADYRRRLRDRYNLLMGGSKRTAMRRGLELWRDYLQGRMSKKQLRDRALRHWLSSASGRAFRRWRDYRQHLRDAEDRASDILRRWRRRDAAGALEAFRNYVQHKKKKRRAEELHKRARQRQVLSLWHDWLHMKVALDLWTGNTLRLAFRSWRQYTQRKRHLNLTMDKVARRWRNLGLSTAFFTWRDWVVERLRLKRVAHQVMSKMRGSALRNVFDDWRLYASRLSQLKSLLARVFLRSVALAFYGWRHVVENARSEEQQRQHIAATMQQLPHMAEVAAYSMTRMRNYDMAVAFYTWYDNVQEAKHLREGASRAIFAYAGTLLRKAWLVWRDFTLQRRHLRAKLTHFLVAMGGLKMEKAFYAWRAIAPYLQRLRQTFDTIQRKMYGRSLREAFHEWRAATDRKRDALGRAAAMIVRWQQRALSTAFNGWLDFCSRRAAAKRLAVRVFGRLVDWAWQAWCQAVQESAMERGGALHEWRLVRRAFFGWLRWHDEQRRNADLIAALHQRLALTTLAEWRRQHLAISAMKRLYLRRAFTSWRARQLELAMTRAKLWHAARVLLYGSMARCFGAWWQYAQAMAIKRAVFARKQRAIQEALRLGDAIARQRARELLEACFRAWQLRVGVFRKVARRMLGVMARTLATSFMQWRYYAADRHSLRNRQMEFVWRRLQAKPFRAWRRIAAEEAKYVRERFGDALEHWRAYSMGRAVEAWRRHVAGMAAKRDALRTVYMRVAAWELSELLHTAWAAWGEFMVQRVQVEDLVLAASRSRQLRIKGEVLDLWLKFTRAMREGGIDPGSPYLSPRHKDDERRLVSRMAALVGTIEADIVPDGDDLYESEGRRQAQERRERLDTVLALTSRRNAARSAVSTGGMRATGGGGTPATGGLQRMLMRSGSATSGGSAGSGASDSPSVAALLMRGVDLTDRAAFVVRATPGLMSAGKGRGPASGYHLPSHHGSEQGELSVVDGEYLREDFEAGAYNDRVDLSRMYGTPPKSFRGFNQPQQQRPPINPATNVPGQPIAPAMPLPPRGNTPLTATGPAMPRRIDFSAMSARQQQQLASAGGYGQAPKPGPDDYDDDSASTTSSDMMGPPGQRGSMRLPPSAATTVGYGPRHAYSTPGGLPAQQQPQQRQVPGSRVGTPGLPPYLRGPLGAAGSSPMPFARGVTTGGGANGQRASAASILGGLDQEARRRTGR